MFSCAFAMIHYRLHIAKLRLTYWGNCMLSEYCLLNVSLFKLFINIELWTIELLLYRSGSKSIVQVLQQARTKKIINKTASSNWENPQKTKQFCVQTTTVFFRRLCLSRGSSDVFSSELTQSTQKWKITKALWALPFNKIHRTHISIHLSLTAIKLVQQPFSLVAIHSVPEKEWRLLRWSHA